jgi:BirA family biotin operon repressor/biotin-[acetyl-CoA-carboxylase] ligase
VATSSFAIQRFKEISSTNDWLLAAARGGAADRTVVVADFQLRGRGRMDRRWEAPPGTSLLASVLLRTTLTPPERHLATVAVGLSALEACQTVASLRAALKWPNDLVVSDRKLGGLLAETDGGASETAIVIGIGMNLTWSGPAEAHGTSILEETGVTVERDAMLDALLVGLDHHAEELATAKGRASLLDAYRIRLSTIGRVVRVSLHDESFVGTAQGVGDDGHLIVATNDGQREVAAGDVVHVRLEESGSAERRE